MAAPIVVGTLLRRSKRARTAQPNQRDWANLTAGPAGLIAQQVLEDDVAGYLRFRAVCGAWRRCTEPPCVHGSLDSRFHPRRWIMLPEVFIYNVDRRDFLNVSTGEHIRADLPELRGQLVIGHTSGGLLVLLCRNGTGNMSLLNPLTRQLTALPNAAPLLNSQDKLEVLSAGLADSSTVALHLDDREMELAVAMPGDERWSYHARPKPASYWETDSDSIVSALSFADRFYCVTEKGVKAVDAAAAPGRQPQLAVVVEEGRGAHENYLVDNDGELVRVRPRPGLKMPRYEAHRVDMDAGRMVPVDDLRGRAVFVCNGGRSVSVRAGLSPSVKANTVYRCTCNDDSRPTIGAYHLKKGWKTFDMRVRRGSTIDYLSRYVCRSKDAVVPAALSRCRGAWAAAEAAAAGDPRKRKRKANSMVIGDEWVN